MGRRYSEEQQEYWRRHVEGYELSGQTREAYSASQGIKMYQLDYWRWKFKRQSAVSLSVESWIPVRIVEEENTLDLN